jgi:hypothetical protein
MILEHGAPACREMPIHAPCCFGTTGGQSDEARHPLALPQRSAVWHNGSQLLERVEKVPMAGAKSRFLAKFIR